ncbi:MAG: ferritin-like domain-containing protein [Candidatus Bathyarchaeota archaeon]
MSSNDELVDLFKSQIKTEQAIVESVKTGLVDIKNPAVKGVLEAISLDSTKHAQMYCSALTLLTEVPQALTEENLEKQKELVKIHIDLEAQVIQKLVEALPNVKNDKVKLLLEAILSDEKRHHDLLTKILECFLILSFLA